MHDETLNLELRQLLPDDDIVGGFVGLSGPRYGVEALLPALVLPAILGGAAIWVTTGLVLLGALGIELFRRRYTIAFAGEEIAVVANSRWRHRRPRQVERRYAATGNLHMEDERSGDKRVRVGPTLMLWVVGRDLDEARRLSKLASDV